MQLMYTDDDVKTCMHPAGPDKAAAQKKIRELKRLLKAEKSAVRLPSPPLRRSTRGWEPPLPGSKGK